MEGVIAVLMFCLRLRDEVVPVAKAPVHMAMTTTVTQIPMQQSGITTAIEILVITALERPEEKSIK